MAASDCMRASRALIFINAVGLTPEMLPMVISVNLAKGALAMAKKKVIVKRLSAIQNLGGMDVLCTDKTGTLTQNRVVLERHVDLFGEESLHVLELAYLNSHHQTGLRNLLDVAILEHAGMREHVHVARAYRKLDEIPFDFDRRRMSVALAAQGAPPLLICKGAVEEILAVCTRAEENGRAIELTDAHRAELAPVIASLNEDGMRVIAVAYRDLPAAQTVCSAADEQGLVLAGYVAFLDPPKETAGAAVAALGRHGVAIKVLTGDNEAVTLRVCRMVGLDPGTIVTGSRVDALDDRALAELAPRTAVFAKLDPPQKARIIAALRAAGHVVGYLGDGINDGPALKAADVGLSVEGAADVARESADMILLEKSLMVLDDGVIEGRRVFANVLKYLRMGASSSVGNMLSVTGASLFLPFLPMLPVQILLNNLLYDVSQSAIAVDNVDPGWLERPRVWDIAGIGRAIAVFAPVSALFDFVTFFVLLAVFRAGSDPALFQTGWFLESVLTQTLIVHVIRTAGLPFRDSRPGTGLVVATLAVCAVALVLPFSGFAAALGFVVPPAAWWPVLAVIVLAYLAACEAAKRALAGRLQFQ